LFRDLFDVHHFHCPAHWVLMTQLGYSLAWIAHGLTKQSEPRCMPGGIEKATQVPARTYFTLMCLDALSMAFAYTALGTISAAVVQMMRGIKLVIITFISKFVFKKRPAPQQVAGVGLAVLGLLVLMLGTLKADARASTALNHGGGGSKGLAFLLCFVGEVFNACFYIYQEHVTKKYDMPAYHTVGVMGLYGTISVLIVVVLLNLARVEDSFHAIDLVSHSMPLALSVVGYIILLGVYEISGTVVSKQGSAILRALIDVSRGALIWVVELEFRWVRFELLHAVGFTMIVLSTLVHTGVIHLPLLDPGPEAACLLEEAPEAKTILAADRKDPKAVSSRGKLAT